MKFASAVVTALCLRTSMAGDRLGRGSFEDKVTPYLRALEGHTGGSGKTQLVCTIETADVPPPPAANTRFCIDTGVDLEPDAEGLLSNVPGASEFLKYFDLYTAEGYTVGSITENIVEAADASITGAPIEDGMAGDVAFPFGMIKPIVTAGERSVCDESRGQVIVGKPDGMGAYLKDDETVRVLFQSESYGPLTQNEAWAFPVNQGAALMGGSHINYVDYDRQMLKDFMTSSMPASSMVTGVGQHIKFAYNLRGEPLARRNRTGATSVGAHLSNTNAAGEWAVASLPRIEYDWFYQSLCSAHMEEAHQWGPGIGVEDDLFITNEEWHTFADDSTFVGNSVHVLDVATDTMWAVGSFSLGGFEKQSEINSQHPDFVMFAISGYNGAYGSMPTVLAARNAMYGNRTEDEPWVLPENIHPYRFYLGRKGLMEDGSPAPASDFLARNGLRYGQIYGFAIDMTPEGPTGGVFRDEFHRGATNGQRVEGRWVAQEWRWNGTVVDFQHDGSWDWQVPVPGEGNENFVWWNAGGLAVQGAKTEHISPDTRPGNSAYIQTSTAGYFGHCYIQDVPTILGALGETDFPASFPGEYYVYQGEGDVRAQIELGGKGQYKEGPEGELRDATCNYDNADNGCKETFEDIDGMEVVCGADDCCRAILQEDSGNDLGERCFITSCLEHEEDGNELTYYFVAMSGGVQNSRMTAKVGIPKTSNDGAGSHEFSGVFDLSGLLRKENDQFTFSASDPGYIKREEEKKVLINDKDIMINVQASNMNDRIMVQFGADTGGQVMIYKPMLPN